MPTRTSSLAGSVSGLDLTARLLDLFHEDPLGGQGGPILGGQDFVRKPASAYFATASSFLAQRTRPTGGFSSGIDQCSRA